MPIQKQHKRNDTKKCQCVNKYNRNENLDCQIEKCNCNCDNECNEDSDDSYHDCKSDVMSECDARTIELYERYKNAVINISTKYIREGEPQLFGSGNGFIFEYNNNLFVLTSAHVVLRSTVIDPMTSMLGGVQDVNGTVFKLKYKLEIVGVDAKADVAVLRLINEGQIDFPRVGKHPTIIFGDERKVPTGKTIFNISTPLAKDLQSFVKGSLRDDRWFDTFGNIRVSCVTTSLLVYASSSGSPVLDAETGLCLGIVSFGFSDTANTTAIGFGGGCGASTIKLIIDHILNNRSVTLIIANNGTRYVTNKKGYFGLIEYIGANTNNIHRLYPDNYVNLQSRGFILTKADPNGPLARPLDGPPVNVGDIIVWIKFDGKTIIIGSGTNQDPLGTVLWKINPSDNNNNIIEIGLIRNPHVNSNIEPLTVRMNINYNPATEIPPTGNTLFTQLLPGQTPVQTPDSRGFSKAIFLIRHAEDEIKSGFDVPRSVILPVPTTLPNGSMVPRGTTYNFRQYRLSASGQDAANKYAEVLPRIAADLVLSPIKKVIVKEPPTLNNNFQSTPNPFDTIFPFVQANSSTIQNMTIANINARPAPDLSEIDGSQIICWDKEGMCGDACTPPYDFNTIFRKLNDKYGITNIIGANNRIPFPDKAKYVVYIYEINRLRVYSVDMSLERPTYEPYDPVWVDEHEFFYGFI